MTAESIPVAPLSIWEPVHLGTDELGRRVEVTMAERNMLIGGEPGSGKSVALQLIVAHGALSPDCRLILVDGKRVELGLWRDCAERFIGPSIDDAIDTLHWLQDQIDERTAWLLDHKMRKITPDLGWPVYLMPIDEVAGFLRPYRLYLVAPAVGVHRLAAFDAVARGRAPGIIPVEATQRPSAVIIPKSLRDLFGYRWAFRCSITEAIPGHHPRAWLSQRRATRPPRSTRRPVGCPGCGPRTAFPAGSRPLICLISRSSTSPPPPPPGPPRRAPPTTHRPLLVTGDNVIPLRAGRRCRVTGPYRDQCPACGSHQVIPYAVLVGASEEYGYQCLVCQVMWPVLTYPATATPDAVPADRNPSPAV